jgi:selenocysteine-specific elongation factor
VELDVRDRARGGHAVLHVDRSFTIHGAGTVVTGTLWSGVVAREDRLVVLPAGRSVRVRAVQVHDERVDQAAAGQRVAVNLAGVELRDVGRGDVLAAPGAALEPAWVLDAELALRDARHGQRVHVHHGTRDAPGRLAQLGGELWQLRLERPLIAAAGDRVVVRSIAPPDTLGGGRVLDPRARKHGSGPKALARLERLRRGESDPPAPSPAHPPAGAPPAARPPAGAPPLAPLSPAARELERRLREAGHEPPTDRELGDAAIHLPALRAAGRAVRLGRTMHAHPDALAAVRERVVALAESGGDVTLAALRDELGTSRKFAQALLEHLDAAGVTLRLPDDRRVLRRRRR